MTLARPYAVAAYQRAKETGSTGQWETMLQFLETALADAQLQQAASNPQADKERFLSAFFDLGQDHLNDDGKNFVRLLVHNHRLGLMPSIRTLFSHYRAEDEGYIDVSVATAFPLDAEEEQDIAGLVEKNAPMFEAEIATAWEAELAARKREAELAGSLELDI